MNDRQWLVKAIIRTLKRLKTGDLMHVYKITMAYADRAKKGK